MFEVNNKDNRTTSVASQNEASPLDKSYLGQSLNFPLVNFEHVIAGWEYRPFLQVDWCLKKETVKCMWPGMPEFAHNQKGNSWLIGLVVLKVPCYIFHFDIYTW